MSQLKIVILDDYSVELVPTKLLETTERSSTNLETARKEFKDRIKHVLEKTFDYDSGIAKLKQLYTTSTDSIMNKRNKEQQDIRRKSYGFIRRMGSLPVLWRTSLQFQNGFEYLVSEFFKSCQDQNVKETFWIIKVTENVGINDQYEYFAAAKDGAQDDDKPKHVEKVFTDWWELLWPSYAPFGNSPKVQFKVYSNYAPCLNSEKFLNNWLNKYPKVKLSIYYVFDYIDGPSDETEIEQPSDETSSRSNRVKTKRITDPTFLLEKLKNEISLKMDWQIVISDDYTVELVPSNRLFKLEGTLYWLPYKSSQSNHGLSRSADTPFGTNREAQKYTAHIVKSIVGGAADYGSGLAKLKQLSTGINKLVERTGDREENATGSDAAAMADGRHESDLAPKVDLNLVQLWQTSLQFQNGFNYLVRDFDTNHSAWIIKLTESCDEGSEYTFAAAEVDWQGHVEKVFTHWWELGQKHDYENTIEVYTYNEPDFDRVKVLNEWLLSQPLKKVKLSINYKIPSYSLTPDPMKIIFDSITQGKLTFKRITQTSWQQLVDDIRGRM